MKFKCPGCKRVFSRNLSHRNTKECLTPKGNYKSYCDESCKVEYCKPIKK